MTLPNFEGYRTTERWDRNIFKGNGRYVTIHPKKPVELYYFYVGNVLVGIIYSEICAMVYSDYKRGSFIPVQIWFDNKEYCGWIDVNKIDLLAN